MELVLESLCVFVKGFSAVSQDYSVFLYGDPPPFYPLLKEGCTNCEL